MRERAENQHNALGWTMTSHLEHDLVIRSASPVDSESLARIYNHYVRTTTITFEEAPLKPAELQDRLEGILAIPLPWLVAEASGKVVGYAFAKKWRDRSAYRFSVETSVFLDPRQVGIGIGTRLYERLLHELRIGGLHVAMGGIALPNEASIALHKKLGFSKVAQFAEVGFKFDKWIDVSYWQKTL